MPRKDREKEEDAIYHIMVRSISEIDLFKKDKDKDEYLKQMRHYQKIFNFKVYSYCLMTNHAHFIIDTNGADITKIMHGLNFKYAITYNRVYKRHGHLFQDRFKSIIVGTNEYLTTLSAYIHRNPIVIGKYKYNPEKYKYSSLKVYLGLEKDQTGLLDEEFILKLFDSDVSAAREKYLQFVYLCDDKKLREQFEFQKEKTKNVNYRKVLIRDFKPEDVIEFISQQTSISNIMIYIKSSKKNKKIREARALAALLMRSLCNFKCGDICKVLGNITQSRVSKLCSIGVELVFKEGEYRDIFEKFINQKDMQEIKVT